MAPTLRGSVTWSSTSTGPSAWARARARGTGGRGIGEQRGALVDGVLGEEGGEAGAVGALGCEAPGLAGGEAGGEGRFGVLGEQEAAEAAGGVGEGGGDRVEAVQPDAGRAGGGGGARWPGRDAAGAGARGGAGGGGERTGARRRTAHVSILDCGASAAKGGRFRRLRRCSDKWRPEGRRMAGMAMRLLGGFGAVRTNAGVRRRGRGRQFGQTCRGCERRGSGDCGLRRCSDKCRRRGRRGRESDWTNAARATGTGGDAVRTNGGRWAGEGTAPAAAGQRGAGVAPSSGPGWRGACGGAPTKPRNIART